MTITPTEFVDKRDSLCRSLVFLVDECQDTDDPFFLMTAAILLQVCAQLKLAEPGVSMELLESMIGVMKKGLGL